MLWTGIGLYTSTYKYVLYSNNRNSVFPDASVEKAFEKADLRRVELKTDMLCIYVAEGFE